MNFKDPITPEEKFILACDLIREYIATKETIYEAGRLLSLASKEGYPAAIRELDQLASDQRNNAFLFLTDLPEEEWCEKISDDIFWMLSFAAKYGDEYAQEIMDSPGKLAEKYARGFEKRCREFEERCKER